MSETVQTPKFECVILSQVLSCRLENFSLLRALLLGLQATKITSRRNSLELHEK